MSKRNQPIEQQEIDLKREMEIVATRMTNLAMSMMIYANCLVDKGIKTDTAIEVQTHANELTGAASILLDWHDALFPKPVTDE